MMDKKDKAMIDEVYKGKHKSEKLYEKMSSASNESKGGSEVEEVEVVKAKAEADVKVVKAKSVAREDELDGWKDEWLIGVFSLPIIVTFIAVFIVDGWTLDMAWASLQGSAEWYYSLLGTMILISFGLKAVVLKLVDWWITSKSGAPAALTVDEIEQLFKTFNKYSDK